LKYIQTYIMLGQLWIWNQLLDITHFFGNLMTWKKKKTKCGQNMMARSSAETEFQAMTQGICEFLWLKIISGYINLLICYWVDTDIRI